MSAPTDRADLDPKTASGTFDRQLRLAATNCESAAWLLRESADLLRVCRDYPRAQDEDRIAALESQVLELGGTL
jgi:hypothetical protein